MLVQAKVERLGKACAGMRITRMHMTGKRLNATQQGGFDFSPGSHGKHASFGWRTFGKLAIKLVSGKAAGGVRYLNILVRDLTKVGGQFCEGDHTAAATPDRHATGLSI